MKINDKVIAKLVSDVSDDLRHIVDENMERFLKDLAEQISSGGDDSLTLKISVAVQDDSSSQCLRAQTVFGWDRKVKVSDAYLEHVIDCGPTLFDQNPPAATINIDMDAKCDECGKAGRCGNGLCLDCSTKAIAGKKMKSAAGKAVAKRTV